MICPNCGLALPAVARFCARCGVRVGAAQAPVWLLVLLWLGACGLLGIAAIYGSLALGAVPPGTFDQGMDAAQLRSASALLAACAASLCAAHGAAALGLMGGRPWARTLATMVCVVWALTCIGLPVGLLGISALWRTRARTRPAA
jgi:hypothetical protein